MNEKWEYAKLPAIKGPAKKIDASNLVSLGSCFARNINRWLSFYGLTNRRMPWDILYNPFSLSMELIRLFEKVNWQEGIINSGKDKKVLDPWRTWNKSNSIIELADFNKGFDKTALTIVEQASSFLFTFGLAEIWYHAKHALAVNQLPLNVINDNDGVWKSRFAKTHEVSDIISRLIGVIRKNFGKNTPIIFTLSPVPLKYTFSGLSVRQANNISKSTILLALHEILAKEKNVNYFPTYEIVQALVEQGFPVWQEDGRHISAAAVDFISRKFLFHYCGAKKFSEDQNGFWVPRVNNKGDISGRLFVNGDIFL